MKTEYITIKEFAEMAGVSQQSIYKRLNKKDNPLQPYFKEVEGKKFLRKTALALYEVEYAADIEDELPEKEPEIKPEEKAAAAAAKPKEKRDNNERLLDLLEQQLREKDKQLMEKDRQLLEKDKQLSSLLDRLEEANQIINQQQQLTALDKKTILEIDEKEETAVEPLKEPELPRKKGFFGFFRK